MLVHKQIKTFKEFHRNVPKILKKLNEDSGLAIRALANPLLAFDEMGFRLSDDVAMEVEKFTRFTLPEQKRLDKLEKELSKFTERKIDFRSTKDVEAFITKDLKIRKPSGLEINSLTNAKNNAQIYLGKKELVWKDSLEQIKSKHPAMKPLLELRSIYNNKPGFASKASYNELKSGKRKLPISGIKIIFPANFDNHEEDNHG